MENELRIAVKQIDNGVFSVYANTELKKGDAFQICFHQVDFLRNFPPHIKKNVLFLRQAVV